MKKYIFLTAAIAAFSSCSSDNDPIVKEDKQVLVFTATLESNDTRATLDGKTPSWEVGDQININGKTYSAAASGSSTTFSATITGQDAEGPTFNAYFPATIYNAGTPSLPTTQTYESGKFNMPMFAESTTTEFVFRNLCAVLAVKVTSADIATLKSIKVKADKKLNGSFTVTDNKAVVGSDGTNELVLESSSALTLYETGTIFYIAIPAQEYKYLNIYLSADGITYKEVMATKKAAGLGDIARNTIYSIDYEKNAVQLWATGPFFATMNIGATSETDYGDYFTWGGIYKNGDRIAWQDDHNTTITGSGNLSSEEDTATKLWGNNWRMPTSDELKKLDNEEKIVSETDNCTIEWKNDYKTTGKGMLFTGNSEGYTTCSVFLPAAGRCKYDTYFYTGSVINSIAYGYYWASSPHGSDCADDLIFCSFSSGFQYLDYDWRYYGCSIRAVLKE